MPWPCPTDYNEAIQNLGTAVGDGELRAGQPASNSLQLPMVWTGNFAAVYKIDCPATGNSWALKCFTHQIPRQRDRYRRIAKHLDRARLSFTVDFDYQEKGIRVRGEWFPALKMRWVKGLALNQFVEEHLQSPKTLTKLLSLWVKLAERLHLAGVAHADLQHGNVLLVPQRRGQLALRLIDYDGMYVPQLAGTRSGEVGHPAYQHPQRLREGTYSAEVDRFSHLAIYSAIRCLTVGRRDLWQQFNTGDNLLYREQDFKNPHTSEAFAALWGLRDANARALVGRLILACRQPLESVPLLKDLVSNGSVVPLSGEEERAVDSLLGAKTQVVARSVTDSSGGARSWIGGNREPSDFYELLGKRRGHPHQGELLAAIKVLTRELLMYQNMHGAEEFNRIHRLQVTLGRAQQTFSELGRWRQYDESLVTRFAAEYASGAGDDPSLWEPKHLRRWLDLVAEVHPDRLDEFVERIIPVSKPEPPTSPDADQPVTDDLIEQPELSGEAAQDVPSGDVPPPADASNNGLSGHFVADTTPDAPRTPSQSAVEPAAKTRAEPSRPPSGLRRSRAGKTSTPTGPAAPRRSDRTRRPPPPPGKPGPARTRPVRDHRPAGDAGVAWVVWSAIVTALVLALICTVIILLVVGCSGTPHESHFRGMSVNAQPTCCPPGRGTLCCGRSPMALPYEYRQLGPQDRPAFCLDSGLREQPF